MPVQTIYNEFQKDVFTILKDMYQRKLSDLDKGDGKKVLAQSKLYEFQDQNLNLEDPFLKSKAIEYPVRCVCCSFDKCSDIRTYIGNFLLNKKKQQTGKLDKQQKFQCPLCSKTFSKTYESLLNHQFQNYIYLDQNLLKRLLEHKEYINTKIFKYEGRQYMLDEFKKRHKIFAADVKEQCEQYQTEYMEYDNLNCIVTGKRLKIPLQLYKCPQKKYIDFYVFYEEYKRTGYDLAKGVVLCECQTCNDQPVLSIDDVFFMFSLMNSFTQHSIYQETMKHSVENLNRKQKLMQELKSLLVYKVPMVNTKLNKTKNQQLDHKLFTLGLNLNNLGMKSIKIAQTFSNQMINLKLQSIK